MMLLLYRILTLSLTPLVPIYLKRRAVGGKEDATRLGERYGIAGAPRPEGALIWIHAASVGETQSVLPLIDRILQRNKTVQVLLTTGTVTSAQMVAEKQLPRFLHQFVPLDHYCFVRRFLQHWRPDVAVWVESEFWPELMAQAAARRIPLMLINARMSEKSVRRWRRMRSIITPLLQRFSQIIACTAEDAARLKSLGAPVITAIANLKYDAPPLLFDASQQQIVLQQMAGRPCLLAASTHEGEEAIIAQLVLRLRKQFPEILCIIVPRHATRGEALTAMLRAQGFDVAQRAKNQPIMPETRIYLVDTMGELGLFFNACNIVIMGGSLVPHGGHNLLEPARFKCAIITGNHMQHFTEMLQHMRLAGAVLQVRDSESLYAACAALLAYPEKALNLGEKAWQFAQQSQGACDAVLDLLQPYVSAIPHA